MTYVSRRIYYFADEGRGNLPDTLRLVRKYAEVNTIHKLVVFTIDGVSATKLKRSLPTVDVIAVTFPVNPIEQEGEDVKTTRPLTDPSARRRLMDKDIEVLIGPLPLAGVMIPRAEDPKLMGIEYALRLFGGGMSLCVQAATMATDAGLLTVGEEAVVMSADTAIVVRASTSNLMFHPRYGLQIRHIICKPASLTITRENMQTSTRKERR